MNQKLADHTIEWIEIGAMVVAAESGVDHSDQTVVLTGQDEAAPVKIRLREEQLVEQIVGFPIRSAPCQS